MFFEFIGDYPTFSASIAAAVLSALFSFLLFILQYRKNRMLSEENELLRSRLAVSSHIDIVKHDKTIDALLILHDKCSLLIPILHKPLFGYCDFYQYKDALSLRPMYDAISNCNAECSRSIEEFETLLNKYSIHIDERTRGLYSRILESANDAHRFYSSILIGFLLNDADIESRFNMLINSLTQVDTYYSSITSLLRECFQFDQLAKP